MGSPTLAGTSQLRAPYPAWLITAGWGTNSPAIGLTAWQAMVDHAGLAARHTI